MYSTHGTLLNTLYIYTYYCTALYTLNHVHYVWRAISRTELAWHVDRDLNPCKVGTASEGADSKDRTRTCVSYSPSGFPHLFHPRPLHLFIWFYFKETKLVQSTATLPFRKTPSYRLKLWRNPRESPHGSHAFKLAVSNKSTGWHIA